MGSYNSTYTEAEIINQLKTNDPLFEYQNYANNDTGMTIQDVMSIRQCFLQLRDEY